MNQTYNGHPSGFIRIDDAAPHDGERCIVIFSNVSGTRKFSEATWDIDVFNDREDASIFDFDEWTPHSWKSLTPELSGSSNRAAIGLSA